MNEKDVKLKVKSQFYCSVEKKLMREGCHLYADSNRAVTLVSGGYADVVERPPVKEPEKEVEVKVEKPIVAKAKVAAKPAAKAKAPVKKAVKK